jgi:transaldolase/glucose-6-phosphate isomerase
MSSAIEQLNRLGQSLWYDNIERRLLDNGQLAEMIRCGDITGLTSNPSIFHNAIANSHDYDSALTPMAWAGYSAKQIFEQLAIEDIRVAADLLQPVFEATEGGDGYVSLEVSPGLAYDSSATLAEALRLWTLVNRPNLMIKIPATKLGLIAIRQAIEAGINVNTTLIFSNERYEEVMDAYLSGLEDRMRAGLQVSSIASVASFFISRMDSKVDKNLENVSKKSEMHAKKANGLLGKVAIANARLAYQEFRRVFEGDRFTNVKAKGGRVQRPLWASTSTKNPTYPNTMYVDELIGAQTVNTLPPQTLEAFRDHGKVRLSVENDLEGARAVVDRLKELGISLAQVTSELEDEGVQTFAKAFQALLDTIEERRLEAVAELGPLSQGVANRVANLEAIQVSSRMHRMDPSLWTKDPQGQAEVKIRLGWLGLPASSRKLIPDLTELGEDARQAGFTNALLLGMGGSSLAPEVLRNIFGVSEKGLDLAILDSTDPAQVLAATRHSPAKRTLYIVASKSGGTAEVNAFLDYFWNRTLKAVGKEKTPAHFIAITDPGTSLERLAIERGFRKVVSADPLVGGRYSALTAFGLLPAALLGMNIERLLDRAEWMAMQCADGVPSGRNPGLVLGAILGEAILHGRDKLTLIADNGLEPFGSWLEQLIAESSGKLGTGIVPVDGEPPTQPAGYKQDRIFIYLKKNGRYEHLARRLLNAGHPVLTFDLPDAYALGAEFYRWEVATAIACVILEVNAFDQPDVQDAKTRTKAMIAAYQANGVFDEGDAAYYGEGVSLFVQTAQTIESLGQGVRSFVRQGKAGDYVAINAYIPRNRKNISTLSMLRIAIRDYTGLATTMGFGPRFLHSTGQLHKGGADNGLFLIITYDPIQNMDIPGEGLSFGALIRGQALGDLEALRARNRRVLRVHLDNLESIKALIGALCAP